MTGDEMETLLNVAMIAFENQSSGKCYKFVSNATRVYSQFHAFKILSEFEFFITRKMVVP